MVENMFHHLLFLFIIISTSECKHQCNAAIIKEPYTFTYSFIHKPDTLYWEKDGEKIVLCFSLSCSIITLSDENTYNATISNSVTTLTIKVVTTHSIGNYVSCYNNSQVSECFNCSLRVYDPVNPDSGPNVGGIVGGTVAAVLVIICVIVFVKRKMQINNTDSYNVNTPTPAIAERDSRYRIFSRVTPTITTATPVTLSMGNNKPIAVKEENNKLFLDPSLQPEIPETNFQNSNEDTNKEKNEDQE